MSYKDLDRQIKKIRRSIKKNAFSTYSGSKKAIDKFYAIHQDNFNNNQLYCRRNKLQLQIDSFQTILIPFFLSIVVTLGFSLFYDYVFKEQVRMLNNFESEATEYVDGAIDKAISEETKAEIEKVANKIIRDTKKQFFMVMLVLWVLVFIVIKLIPHIFIDISSMHLRKRDVFIYEIEIINEILKIRDSKHEYDVRLSVVNGKNKLIYKLIECVPFDSDNREDAGES